MATEAGDVYALQPFGTSTEERRKAGITVCRNTRTQAEAERLLDMLGLRETEADAPRPTGCRTCGGPIPAWATAPKCGMKGTCSAACKRLFVAGEVAEVIPDRVAAAPARKHIAALLDIPEWTLAQVSREAVVHVDVIRGVMADTDTHRLHTIASIDAEKILAVPIPDLPPAPPRDWREQARCLGEDPERWFPISGNTLDASAAQLCERCPVRVECARFAKVAATDGVFAGFLLPEQKEELAAFVVEQDNPTAAAPEPVAPRVHGFCNTCGCETYDSRNRLQRDAPGRRSYGGRGMCKPCYERDRRAAQPITPDEAAERITELRAAGWLLDELAEATGLTTRTLQNVQGRRVSTIRPATAEAIFAVELREMAVSA
jgi:lambda repressor-like predicted transcriptional regulator